MENLVLKSEMFSCENNTIKSEDSLGNQKVKNFCGLGKSSEISR